MSTQKKAEQDKTRQIVPIKEKHVGIFLLVMGILMLMFMSLIEYRTVWARLETYSPALIAICSGIWLWIRHSKKIKSGKSN